MTARSYTTIAASATLLALVAVPSFGQVNLGDPGVKDKAAAVDEKAGAAKDAAGAGEKALEAGQGAAPAGGTMERLQGAAGVGVSTGTGEVVKGAGAGAAAKKGGAAAVQDYMKQPKEAGAGAGAPVKGEVGEVEGAPADAPEE